MSERLLAREGFPEDAKCPITLEVMRDPVLLRQTGNTFERRALESALRARANVDPKSNQRFMGAADIQPLRQMRNLIEQIREMHAQSEADKLEAQREVDDLREALRKMEETNARLAAKIEQARREAEEGARRDEEDRTRRRRVNPNLVAGLETTLQSYNGSNYFHVAPRHDLFDKLTRLMDGDTQNIITSAEDKREARQTINMYQGSCYFHVGPRYHLFGVTRKYIEASR